MNPSKRATSRLDMINRAVMIARTLGVRNAASYLRRQNFSIDAALWILARKS